MTEQGATGPPRVRGPAPRTTPTSPTSTTASSGSGPRTGWSTSAATSPATRPATAARSARRPTGATPRASSSTAATHCYVVMNLFPYNPGHVLVCPYRHVSLYVDLTDEETDEFTALTKQAIRALEAASGPHGFNLGMNQGAVAGAGVAAHLHQHVVPRWGGDSNFLPIVARPRPCPMLLEDVRTAARGGVAGGLSPASADRLDRTMLNRLLRETWTKVMTPIATLFLRLGISPDVVTIVGTVGVCVGALAFFPRGQLLVGTWSSRLHLQRQRRRGHGADVGPVEQVGRLPRLHPRPDRRRRDLRRPGALLRRHRRQQLVAGLALACLILGLVVSYSKARAEGLGITANVGIAERADRLLAALVATFLVGPVGVGRPARRRPRAAVRRQPRHRRAADGRSSARRRSRPARSTIERPRDSHRGDRPAERPGLQARLARGPDPAGASRIRPLRPHCGRRRCGAAARVSPASARTTPGSGRSWTTRRSTPWCAPACAPTCATTARPSGSPSLGRDRINAGRRRAR